MSKRPDFTVAQRGTDSSGRPIFTTAYFWLVWTTMLADERLDPIRHLVVIVQGAFMTRVSGGGASASAGYHDEGGAVDVRTWNMTSEQEQLLWDVSSDYAFWAWWRGPGAKYGDMDEHGHVICAWDRPIAAGIVAQIVAARNKRDGLASNGPDYMKRAHPILLIPPAELLEEDYMATPAAERQLAKILKGQDQIKARLDAAATTDQKRWAAERERDLEDRRRQSERYANVIAAIAGIADTATGETRTQLLQLLAAEPDVTGPDNPAEGKV